MALFCTRRPLWENDAEQRYYLKDGDLVLPERPGINVPPSLVVFSLVTNIVGTA